MPKHKQWLYFAAEDLRAARTMLSMEEIILGRLFTMLSNVPKKRLRLT
jgi:hypothetical protein